MERDETMKTYIFCRCEVKAFSRKNNIFCEKKFKTNLKST